MSEVYSYGPYVAEGIYLTVLLSLSALAVALTIGLLGALGRVAGPKPVAILVKIYTALFRGIPDIVWLFLFYFGGQALIQAVWSLFGLRSPAISPLVSGIVALGLVNGAYMVETFRSAAIAIPAGQIEAARSLGLKLGRILRRIVWPQLFRNSFAGVMNNWLGLIKSTAVVSVIGIHDLVSNAKAAGRATDKPFTFLLISLLIYLVFAAVSELTLQYLNKRNLAGEWSK